MSLNLHDERGLWFPVHCLRLRVDEVGGNFIRLLCPPPSDSGPIRGKVSWVEGCEGVCVLCGFGVSGRVKRRVQFKFLSDRVKVVTV